MNEAVWIFVGAGSALPSGVFTDLTRAEEWLKKNRLTGLLTKYCLDEGVFDWAVRNDFYSVKPGKDISPRFIGQFTTASMPHFHYEAGIRKA